MAANISTGIKRVGAADAEGDFHFDALAPGAYDLIATEPGMKTTRIRIQVHVEGTVQLMVGLQLAGASEVVTVTDFAQEEEEMGQSEVVDRRAIEQLPLNGRRFTDLALLTPGVNQDPRGLNSGGNGDLSFGGIRGYQTSYLVDGVDDNNAFFAQARGRYRAPYQFSDEVIQEFRVSSNGYNAEMGRAGGAVMNVVTRSGSNRIHGSLLYLLRDGRLSATHAFVGKQYPDRQNQGAATIGGPIKRDRIF